MSISQGGQYNNGKMNIVKQGFTSGKREGFVGILGSNVDMDQVITSDTDTTTTGSELLNDDVTQYGDDYKTLRGKTTEYIKAPPESRLLKNYNIFINKITSPPVNQKGCVTTSSISNLSLADGFAAAYPTNFTNYTDAKNACKLWAAYGNKTTFAINKDTDGKYRCYTGNGLNSTITPKTRPVKVYTVLDGDTTSLQGGLFANGQIGVWTGSIIGGTEWDITRMKKPMMLKKYNSQNYSSLDTPFQPAVAGWWGDSRPGTYNNWGSNLFPNDIAWWIGNIPTENIPTASVSYWATSGFSYFYYVYNNLTVQNVFIYYVGENRSGNIKINGTPLTVTERSRTNSLYLATGANGWEATTALPVGKVVCEIKTPTGLPNSGFVFYMATANKSSVLFKSGDPGWVVSPAPAPNYNYLANGANSIDPISLKTLNPVPAGYEKCHSLIGGGVVKGSITATYGKNCSSATMNSSNVRWIRIIPNSRGDYIQINQLVVNAIVNGVVTNVASQGTVTQANISVPTTPRSPLDGTLGYRPIHGGYYSATQSRDNFWKLDLGRDFQVTEIVYYNRSPTECCPERAIGMKIKLTAANGTIYTPITLTGEGVQSYKLPIPVMPTVAPSTNCPGMDCSVEYQRCLIGTPGSARQNWTCINSRWSPD